MAARKILFGVALVLVAALAASSLTWLVPAALTDYSTLHVRSDLEAWREGKRRPDPVAWKAARDEIATAAELIPDNPQNVEDLGFLYAYRALNMPVGGIEAQIEFLQTAAGHYRTATRLRPMFAYSWGHLARGSSLISLVC